MSRLGRFQLGDIILEIIVLMILKLTTLQNIFFKYNLTKKNIYFEFKFNKRNRPNTTI